MNKKITIVSVVVVLIVVIIIAFGSGKKESVSPNEVPNNDLASTTNTVASSTVSTEKPAETILSDSPYVDSAAGYSLFLPKNWIVQDKAQSTTTSNTWFHNPQITGTSSKMSMVVGRFERTEKMNTLIEEKGDMAFLGLLAGNLMRGVNQYAVTATSTLTINGKVYYKTIASYVGTKTQKKVIQYTYYTLTDKAYYMVGIDAYEDMWDANKKALLASMSTIRVSK